jgi:hypothetical protein
MSRSFGPKQLNGNFGEQIVSNLSPVLQVANQYEIDPALDETMEVFTATGGTGDSNDNLWRCQSGTSVGGYAVIRTRSPVRYRAGQGIVGRITSMFTTGIANSLQFAGFFSVTETCAIGYDGADFSVIHDYKGQVEIREINITTGGAASDLVITLNSVASGTIVTTGTNAAANAEQIRAALAGDSAVNGLWNFYQQGDKVICVGNAAEVRSGTYSFVETGAIVGNISQARAGAVKTENRIAQASWNGTDITGWFDPTKLNVFQIHYGYLGSSDITFWVKEPVSGDFVLMHRIQWPNQGTTVNFGQPSMKIGWTAASLGSSGTNLTVQGGSCFAAIEGQESVQNATKAADNSVGSVTTTLTNIITLRGRATYGNKISFAQFEPIELAVDNDHTKGTIIKIIKDATIGGTTDYQLIDENNSVVDCDKSGTTVTGGTIVDEFTVGSNDDKIVDLTIFKIFLLPNETLTVAAETISGSGATITAAIAWLEEK